MCLVIRRISFNEQGICLGTDLLARQLNVTSSVLSSPMETEEAKLSTIEDADLSKRTLVVDVGVQHFYQWPNEDGNAIQEYKMKPFLIARP
jgi:hypothetical protein